MFGLNGIAVIKDAIDIFNKIANKLEQGISKCREELNSLDDKRKELLDVLDKAETILEHLKKLTV